MKFRFTLRKFFWLMTFVAIFMTLAVHVKFAIVYCPPEWVQITVAWDDPAQTYYSIWYQDGKFGAGPQLTP